VSKGLGATGIPYADYGWNVTRGCSKDGRAGCLNCWAARQCATRLKHLPQYAGLAVVDHAEDVYVDDRYVGTTDTTYDWTGEVRFDPDEMERPLHTTKPGFVFTVPRGDLFHKRVTDDQLDQAFSVMAATPHLTYIVVTKRPERMRGYMRGCERGADDVGAHFPWPNVWLVPTVWDQESLERVWRLLSETPAAVRGISYEPALGPLDLWRVRHWCEHCQTTHSSLSCFQQTPPRSKPWLDWVICGPETGPGKRPFDPQWAADVRAQCDAAGVAYYDKRETHAHWREWPGVTS